MPIHDYVIDNQSAPSLRADLNNALQAIVSQNSSATAPTTTYANMIWYDTAANQLKKRNEANSAWVTLGTIDETLGTFTPTGQPIIATQAEAEAGVETTKMMTPQRTSQAIAALGSAVKNYQVFTASGTWTKPSGLSADALVYIEMWGGGGSGAARVRGSGNSGYVSGGGGGGYVSAILPASLFGATVAVVVGAGGASVTASTNTGPFGNTGGTSSFGPYVSLGGNGGTTAAGVSSTFASTTHGFDGLEGGDASTDGSLQSNAVYGGAGGGGSVGPRGTSRFGGNGGTGANGNVLSGAVNAPNDATAPGGGGGGALNQSTGGLSATSGPGARGEVRVWTIG